MHISYRKIKWLNQSSEIQSLKAERATGKKLLEPVLKTSVGNVTITKNNWYQ